MIWFTLAIIYDLSKNYMGENNSWNISIEILMFNGD